MFQRPFLKYPGCIRLPLAFLLAAAFLPCMRAQVSCGAEGQNNCTIGDAEFYTNNNYAGCQYDLRANGSALSNLSGNSTCVDQQRYSLTKAMNADQGWAAWALSQQRAAIGRNEQLNWITTMGTHNSYSNSHQGYTLSMGQNQIYSITDQLNAGARILELDPHAYYTDVNGGHLTVCHGSDLSTGLGGIDINLPNSDTGGCALTSPAYARYLEAVLGEIANWMDTNPQEVLVIFIDDGGDSDHIGGHYQDLQNDILGLLGSRVWTVSNTVSISQGHVPSIAQMQSAGKSIILLSDHYINIDQVHTFDTKGALVAQNTPGAFRSNSTDNASSTLLAARSAFNPLNCADGDGRSALARPRDAWFRLGEGRSLSDWWQTGSAQPLIDSAAVVQATGCVASYIELDFLYALDQVPTSEYSGASPDTRFESGVWSWAKNDYGLNGPASLQNGRWVSSPEFNSSNTAVKRNAACYTVDATADWGARKKWSVTKTAVAWSLAQGECNAEYGAAFGAPANAYENYVLTSTPGADNIWLNHKASNLGDPYATPNPLMFGFTSGNLPGPQSFQVIGKPNKLVKITAVFNISSIAINGTVLGPHDTTYLLLNPAGSATASVTIPDAASQPPGVRYPTTFGISYVDGTGQGRSLEVLDYVAYVCSAKLTPPTQTTIHEGTAWTAAAQVNWAFGQTSGNVQISEIMSDAKGNPYVKPLQAQGLPAFSFGPQYDASFPPLYLSPGVHRIVAVYAPPTNEILHARATSNTVIMTVLPELTFSPTAVVFNNPIGQAVPPAQTVTVSGANGALRLTTGATSLPAWLSATFSTGQVTFSLNSNVINSPVNPLLPGSYTTTVSLSDQTAHVADTIQVTLYVTAALSASAPSLTFATLESQSASAPLTVNDSGKGALPLDITAPAWITWQPVSATTPAHLQFTASPAGHHTGDHLTGTINIKSPAAQNRLDIPVDLYIVPPVMVAANGAGTARVLFDGSPVTLPSTVALIPNSQHTVDASAPIYDTTPLADARYGFKSWNTGSGAVLTFVAPTGNTPVRYDVTYQRQWLLTTLASPPSGGTISASPASPDGFYNDGTALTLTATPATLFTFAGFSGAATSPTSPLTYIIGRPTTLTGKFSLPAAAIHVTFNANVAGPTLLVNGAAYTLPAKTPMTPGQAYTIAAATQYIDAQPGIRWNFQSLNGAGQSTISYTAPTADTTVAVAYTEQFQVSAVANPANGGSVTGTGWYNAGQTAALQAVPNAGFTFGSFTGLSAALGNPLNVPVAAPLAFTANFSVASGINLLATTAGQRADGTAAGTRTVPMEILNNTAGGIGDVRVTSVDTIRIVTGTGDVRLLTSVPFLAGNLVPNGAQLFSLLFNWPATAARVSFTVHFTANAGAYSGSTTVTLNR